MLVYEWLLANGDDLAASGAPGGGSVHVFDPCASKDDAAGRAAVRRLAELAGMNVENHKSGPGDVNCCGFGGHIYPANPGLTEKIVKGRVSVSELPYITYCSNCRDLFLYAGKECRHILDVYFGSGAVPDLPSLTRRRDNRRALKASYAAATAAPSRPPEDGEVLSVDIADGLERKMDRLLLLRADVEEAIRCCERSGKKLIDPASGRFTGFHRNRAVTVWVEYEMKAPSRAILHNTYTHRMEIVE
jgi:hypothetical protein